jgi:hypothetical protein
MAPEGVVMRIEVMLAVTGMLGLAGCGGASPKPNGPATNAFTGTLSITSALPAGTTTCQTPHTVTFTSVAVNVHTVSAAGGDCVEFVNSDTVGSHQPASIGSPACPELDAPGPLAPGATFTTAPLGGPKTCNWEDSLNPPTPGSPGY